MTDTTTRKSFAHASVTARVPESDAHHVSVALRFSGRRRLPPQFPPHHGAVLAVAAGGGPAKQLAPLAAGAPPLVRYRPSHEAQASCTNPYSRTRQAIAVFPAKRAEKPGRCRDAGRNRGARRASAKGTYRLLIGNPADTAPSYDIERMSNLVPAVRSEAGKSGAPRA
jgi:hypothetical protein